VEDEIIRLSRSFKRSRRDWRAGASSGAVNSYLSDPCTQLVQLPINPAAQKLLMVADSRSWPFVHHQNPVGALDRGQRCAITIDVRPSTIWPAPRGRAARLRVHAGGGSSRIRKRGCAPARGQADELLLPWKESCRALGWAARSVRQRADEIIRFTCSAPRHLFARDSIRDQRMLSSMLP